MMKMAKKYWLFKSEADVFSVDDLAKSDNQTTCWDGVRNYQTRNFIRDEMKNGDQVLYYHSNSDPNAVVGICEIVREAYPDFTQFDPASDYFDPSSAAENPTWLMVDIKLIRKLKRPVSLQEIKENPALAQNKLVMRGNRLSVFPVTKEDFDEIIRMSETK